MARENVTTKWRPIEPAPIMRPSGTVPDSRTNSLFHAWELVATGGCLSRLFAPAVPSCLRAPGLNHRRAEARLLVDLKDL